MRYGNPAFERAMKLAVVSGLRAMMGPALVATARRRPERQALVAAAMGEMVIDKLPLVPRRASLPLMLPRAVAGAWVAKQVMEEEGVEDPWAVPLGAAVAAGVAALAPRIRVLARTVLGVPDPLIGLAEDYLALKLGSEAVGLSMEDLKGAAGESIGEMRERVVDPARQSIGAGSI
jgi:hypothetical protein